MTNEEKLREIFPKTIFIYRKEDDKTSAIQCSDEWLNAEYQEPTTKNDLVLIHTEGLDEEIRCTMCTNSMKNDRGCDGSCVVNKDMYKAVMDAIERRIQPTTKNDLGVDCISREQALNEFCIYNSYDNIGVDKVRSYLKALPSVTPQEPKVGHWIKISPANIYECSECGQNVMTQDICAYKFCHGCGAKMVEPQESED